MSLALRLAPVQRRRCGVCRQFLALDNDTVFKNNAWDIALNGAAAYSVCPCCCQVAPEPYTDAYKKRWRRFVTERKIEVGHVYMLRGGHIMRFAGPFERGPNLRFTSVRADNPGGGSFAPDAVLYEVTTDHLDMLIERRNQARARNLHEVAADAEAVLKELTGS